jgi:hypothetical protein
VADNAHDRLILAWIAGAIRRHAARGVISDDQRPLAIADIRETAQGRADLLAEQAGLALGFALAQTGPQASIGRLAAELCIAAGADEAQIERWQAVGYQRATGSREAPSSGAQRRRDIRR